MYKKQKRIKEEDKKNEIINYRCTTDMKRRIERKSEELYGKKNTSKFISDCIESNMKRKTRRDKRHARALVESQEALNRLIINTEDEEMKKRLIDYMKGTMGLWDY